MEAKQNIMLLYDKSFLGLLSAIWYVLEQKINPSAISFKEQLFPFFKEISIKTDEKKATRLINALDKRIFSGISSKIKLIFLSDREDKELLILEYIRFGLKNGKKTEKMIACEPVLSAEKTVKSVLNEAHRIKGFLRFSEHSGILAAECEPNASVLPLVANHFSNRYHKERFIIYDKKHETVLISDEGKISFFETENFSFPTASPEEKAYRILWKEFYDTVCIEERKNEKCRITHLPKRFWGNLTEMSEQNTVKALKEGEK